MSIKMHAYLNFNGNCESAFHFYEKVFKSPASFHRYGDMPSDDQELDESIKKKVLNASISISNNLLLMGSDVIEGFGQPHVRKGNQSYIMLDFDNPTEATEIFKSLSTDANLIEMPLERTFFAELYASFEDQFGIYWMIHYEGDVKFE